MPRLHASLITLKHHKTIVDNTVSYKLLGEERKAPRLGIIRKLSRDHDNHIALAGFEVGLVKTVSAIFEPDIFR
jgi:hypothetical protein